MPADGSGPSEGLSAGRRKWFQRLCSMTPEERRPTSTLKNTTMGSAIHEPCPACNGDAETGEMLRTGNVLAIKHAAPAAAGTRAGQKEHARNSGVLGLPCA